MISGVRCLEEKLGLGFGISVLIVPEGSSSGRFPPLSPLCAEHSSQDPGPAKRQSGWGNFGQLSFCLVSLRVSDLAGELLWIGLDWLVTRDAVQNLDYT
jgi:hypothetical protein